MFNMQYLFFSLLIPYLAIKLNVHILPKSTGVVIFQCFGISKGLMESTTTYVNIYTGFLAYHYIKRNDRQTSRTGLDMSILSLTVFSRAVLGQLTA